ncbi:O-antigen ligase family protein [Neobacillus niacini]|uniref:O-antigen ligase family protein n=1 Tax=Neobacillus niacini TaxID=86668 RepID=UPI0005EEFD23|nr:O-antigen ligase family protein [Neobacillus niacini]
MLQNNKVKLTQKSAIERYDKLLTFSFCLLALVYPYLKHINPNTSFALFNAIVSLFPFIFIWFNTKIPYHRNFDMISLVVILSVFLKLSTFFLNFEHLVGEALLLQLVHDTISILNLIFIYFIFRNIRDQYGLLKRIHIYVLIFAVLFSIYNIVENYSYLSSISSFEARYLINFSSYFTNVNGFGLFLFLSLIAGTYALVDEIRFKRKPNFKTAIILIAILFIAMNLVLTFSRTAILSSIIFFVIFTTLKNRRIHGMFIILALLGASYFIIQIDGISRFIDEYIIKADQGISGRDLIWYYGLQLLSDKPLFGYGTMYGSSLIEEYAGVSGYHNMFLQAAIDGGLFWFVFTCVFILYSLKIAIQVYKGNSKYGALAIASIVSIFAYGMFEGEKLFGFGLFSNMLTTYGIVLPLVLRKHKFVRQEK